MKISIIIPTLNEEELLSQTLDSLVQSTGIETIEYEIIIVDGGSTDQTRDIAARYPAVVWYESNQSGIAVQSNYGAQRATGDMLVFTDAKTIFPKKGLLMISKLSTKKAYFPYIMPLGKNILIYAVFFIQWIWFSVTQFFLPIMPGPCMIVPRELFARTDGFSDTVIFQDIEFSSRLAWIAPIRSIPMIVRISPRRFYREGVIRTCLLYMAVTFLRVIFVFPRKGVVRYEYENAGSTTCVQ